MPLSGLFYAFFIIPCIFFEITRFLYNHFRHTPRTAYFILAIEIILISLYYVIPILVKKFYILTPGKDNKDVILQNKLNSAKKDLIVIEQRIWEMYRYKSGREPLGKDNWNIIIKRYYNGKK